MPYESTLWTKFLVYLQGLIFTYNPYFEIFLVLFFVIFWISFVFGVIKFKKFRKLGEQTLKYKFIIAVCGILFLFGIFIYFSCYFAMWAAYMGV
ncbi:MAG: hypothetical protein IJ211_00430 [Campylobacter sp.]|nr:hypothetical protein [Campylobacter sp.]